MRASGRRQQERTCDLQNTNKKAKENQENREPTEITSGNGSNSNTDEICSICDQHTDRVIVYVGHPQDAVKEEETLTIDYLVSSGKKMVRPTFNLSNFTIYDENGHVVPIDIFTPKKVLPVFMSGYLMPKLSSSDDIDEESVPVKDVGPVINWYINKSDDGEKISLTLCTVAADYNLKKPSTQYQPIMDTIDEKNWIMAVVVDFVEEYRCLQPTYEELLCYVKSHTVAYLNDRPLPLTLLEKHAAFLCYQVANLDKIRNEEPLMHLPCMRELKSLADTDFGKRQPTIEYKKPDKKEFSKAVTTPLVQKIFANLFRQQLDMTSHEAVPMRKRCEVCEACQRPDCGECSACRDMAKFGGHGRTKKVCVRRLCLNMAIERSDESDDDANSQEEEDSESQAISLLNNIIHDSMTPNEYRWIKWIGVSTLTDKNKMYYEKVEMDGTVFSIGDFVMVKTARANIPPLVGKLVCMWKVTNDPSLFGKGFFHAELFIRAADTVLGEVGNPREIFMSDNCCQGVPITSILRKAHVVKKEVPTGWHDIDEEASSTYDDGQTYFYRKHYSLFSGRFVDLPETPVCLNPHRKHNFCPSCERMKIREFKVIPVVEGMLPVASPIVGALMTEWSLVRWKNHEYKKGGGVFLKPSAIQFPKNLPKNVTIQTPDETFPDDVYTEQYRKSANTRGSNDHIGKPFCVGHIAAVTVKGWDTLVPPNEIFLYVNIMYRPENTMNSHPEREDMNLVYWSEKILKVPFSAVAGPCYLIYEGNIPHQLYSIQEWLEQDPSRFYFRSAYNEKTGRIVDVPSYAKSVGIFKCEKREKRKGQGKGVSNEAMMVNEPEKRVWPLRTLDVFAGCGGLSAGLHRAGVAECRWAVENDEAAAHAYSLNNEHCTVFTEDCNALLNEVINGESHMSGFRLPMPGEVELLCGGPPCQGFSGMNRFNSSDYSNFKNSLIATYLSYCDIYRPKYFILENVRNFVVFKRGMVLKLTLHALLEMGYQCTFGVLQAGSYGVPQTRRRVFLIAAAPGRPLPHYPEPTHSFLKRACQLYVRVDGKRFSNKTSWGSSAPRRACTLQDAITDLPEISNGANQLTMEYESPAQTHFQRSVRIYSVGLLRDHICKNMSPLAEARIARLPPVPDADWRNLPNIAIRLSNGVECKELEYRYMCASGALRGVCACAEGRPCDPRDRQENTLIPWCLPHTASRNNQWAGLYGRLDYKGFFGTTLTDPEPMGKQGRVLHPTQPRVVSVRECARSQGFPDNYIFTGSVQDKHRQIGNAVPPPLAEALGREIMKSIIESGDF